MVLRDKYIYKMLNYYKYCEERFVYQTSNCSGKARYARQEIHRPEDSREESKWLVNAGNQRIDRNLSDSGEQPSVIRICHGIRYWRHCAANGESRCGRGRRRDREEPTEEINDLKAIDKKRELKSDQGKLGAFSHILKNYSTSNKNGRMAKWTKRVCKTACGKICR